MFCLFILDLKEKKPTPKSSNRKELILKAEKEWILANPTAVSSIVTEKQENHQGATLSLLFLSELCDLRLSFPEFICFVYSSQTCPLIRFPHSLPYWSPQLPMAD